MVHKVKMKKLVMLGVVLGLSVVASATDFIAYAAETGVVTFTPSVIATPVIGAIVAMITAAVAFIIIRAGWRWAKSLLRG